MKLWKKCIATGTMALFAVAVSAQSAVFKVDSAGQLTAVDQQLSSTHALKAKTPASLVVQCADRGCKTVKATAAGTALTGTASTEDAANFVIRKVDATQVPTSIIISRSDIQTFKFAFTSDGDQADAATTGTGAQATLDKEYSKCTSLPSADELDAATEVGIKAGERQGRRRIDGIGSLFNGFQSRVAVFIVTPIGSVLQRPANVDEGQTVVVAVRASETVAGDLIVKRTSAIRTPDMFRAIGGDTDISKIKLQSKTDAEPEKCTFHYQVLGDDFAPGTATFEIRSFAAQKPVGSVEFGVDALYSGIYSLGAMRCKAVDPDFYLSSDGTTQTIRQRNLGKKDVLYTVMYTPFIWGKRSLQEPPRFWQRFNPTIGLALDHVSDNFVAGVSYDFPIGGLVLTFGKHWRRVSKLDPAANLAPGSPFTGTVDQLPVGKQWDDDKFVALTIDLRAAVSLFQKALRTTSN